MTEREMVAVLVELLRKGKRAEAEAQAQAFRDEYGSWITPKRLLQEANKQANRVAFSERTAMFKVAKQDANSLLMFFDKLANAVEADPRRFGLTTAGARVAMTYIDSAADDFERKTFGEDSMAERQAEMRQRRAESDIDVEPDEPYMNTFENPQETHVTEPDEPYMAEFDTDTSSEVREQYPSGTFTPRQSSYNPFD